MLLEGAARSGQKPGSRVGRFDPESDENCLSDASAHGLTFVTYDRRTIPRLLKSWAEQGLTHGGVIFVDEKTISPLDKGALIRALAMLAKETERWNWANRVYFLRR